MAGRINALINDIIVERAGDNEGLRYFVRAHLLMKGIDPAKYGPNTADDPEIIRKLDDMRRVFDQRSSNLDRGAPSSGDS